MFTVQCDLDSTITVHDVGAALLETLSPDQKWRQIGKESESIGEDKQLFERGHFL